MESSKENMHFKSGLKGLIHIKLLHASIVALWIKRDWQMWPFIYFPIIYFYNFILYFYNNNKLSC